MYIKYKQLQEVIENIYFSYRIQLHYEVFDLPHSLIQIFQILRFLENLSVHQETRSDKSLLFQY